MKIYVASSWRNNMQPKVVEALRIQGHEVYDFKNPEPGNNGFHWSEIDPEWKNWTPDQFANALQHPIAELGFERDMKALMECDACVLVMPCGRSAHLEAGYAIGAGKPTIILLADGEPELMYKMADFVCLDIAGVQGTIDLIADEVAKSIASEAKTKAEYNHVEAFCVMTYQCEKCGFTEDLWNSRDGVTPFTIMCPKCGEFSRHINWNQDIRSENHIPSKGQRIFIDMPESVKKPLALSRIEHFRNTQHQVAEDKKEELIQSIMAGFMEGEPYIITWK